MLAHRGDVRDDVPVTIFLLFLTRFVFYSRHYPWISVVADRFKELWLLIFRQSYNYPRPCSLRSDAGSKITSSGIVECTLSGLQDGADSVLKCFHLWKQLDNWEKTLFSVCPFVMVPTQSVWDGRNSISTECLKRCVDHQHFSDEFWVLKGHSIITSRTGLSKVWLSDVASVNVTLANNVFATEETNLGLKVWTCCVLQLHSQQQVIQYNDTMWLMPIQFSSSSSIISKKKKDKQRRQWKRKKKKKSGGADENGGYGGKSFSCYLNPMIMWTHCWTRLTLHWYTGSLHHWPQFCSFVKFSPLFSTSSAALRDLAL